MLQFTVKLFNIFLSLVLFFTNPFNVCSICLQYIIIFVIIEADAQYLDSIFIIRKVCCCSVVSHSLTPHGLQHVRIPCPSPSPGDCSNSCPLSKRCYQSISSSESNFSYRSQSFPKSGSFKMSWLFISGGQSIGASDSASVFPLNSHGWFPLRQTSLLFKCFSRVFSSSTIQRHHFSVLRLLYGPSLTSIHDYWKNQSFN